MASAGIGAAVKTPRELAIDGEAHRRTVAEDIRSGLDRLTPTERRSAVALLGDYPVAGLETVAKFAARAKVSGPTILRLIAKLGYRSYPDFQRALREELQIRAASPLTKVARARAARDSAGGDFLEGFSRSMCANIEASLRDVPRREFEAAVKLLSDPRRAIHLLGGRFTGALAMQLYLYLREIRPRVRLIQGQTAIWFEYLLDMDRRDVLVVFDIRRYQEDVIQFAEKAARQGVKIVLFTDPWLSPIASVARHVFSLQTTAPSNWDSLSAMTALMEAIVAAVNNRNWKHVKPRIERLEALRATPAHR
jgi:DNA-binding MurR/RpiR family transcriptional regulator